MIKSTNREIASSKKKKARSTPIDQDPIEPTPMNARRLLIYAQVYARRNATTASLAIEAMHRLHGLSEDERQKALKLLPAGHLGAVGQEAVVALARALESANP